MIKVYQLRMMTTHIVVVHVRIFSGLSRVLLVMHPGVIFSLQVHITLVPPNQRQVVTNIHKVACHGDIRLLKAVVISVDR